MQGYNPEVLEAFDQRGLELLLTYLHVFESPAGPADDYKMKLITDQLDSQHNVPIQARFISPKQNCSFKPRAADEVTSLLQALLP